MWDPAGVRGRAFRASVFAGAAVVLGTGAHLMAGGMAPSDTGLTVAGLVSFAALYLLGGQERRWRSIAFVMVAVQAGMHLAFMTTAAAEPARGVSGALAGLPLSDVLCSVSGTAADHAAMGMQAGAGSVMLAVHVLAGLAASWLLARGEALVWALARRARAVRTFLGRLLGSSSPVPVGLPDRRLQAPAGPGGSRLTTVLRHALVLRGPPARAVLI